MTDDESGVQQDEEQSPQHQHGNEPTIGQRLIRSDHCSRSVRVDQRPKGAPNHLLPPTERAHMDRNASESQRQRQGSVLVVFDSLGGPCYGLRARDDHDDPD
jgi:hypothetical protein